MFVTKTKTSVSLRTDNNTSGGDIRRKWHNEAVVPSPPFPPLTIFPLSPAEIIFGYSLRTAMVMNTGSH